MAESSTRCWSIRMLSDSRLRRLGRAAGANGHRHEHHMARGRHSATMIQSGVFPTTELSRKLCIGQGIDAGVGYRWGLRVSLVKPANCFRRLEKLVLPSIFDIFPPWTGCWRQRTLPRASHNRLGEGQAFCEQTYRRRTS